MWKWKIPFRNIAGVVSSVLIVIFQIFIFFVIDQFCGFMFVLNLIHLISTWDPQKMKTLLYENYYRSSNFRWSRPFIVSMQKKNWKAGSNSFAFLCKWRQLRHKHTFLTRKITQWTAADVDSREFQREFLFYQFIRDNKVRRTLFRKNLGDQEYKWLSLIKWSALAWSRFSFLEAAASTLNDLIYHELIRHVRFVIKSIKEISQEMSGVYLKLI